MLIIVRAIDVSGVFTAGYVKEYVESPTCLEL